MSSSVEFKDLRCEVCGRNDRELSITSPFAGPGTVLCGLCQGLIDAGLIRPEVVDGVSRYRQWRMEWTPGELLPLHGTAPQSHSDVGA